MNLRDLLRSKKFHLFLIVLITFALRLKFLHEPFERDEGFYATIAQEILHGGLPYKDAIDVKPPGVHYIYAFAITLFEHSVEGIRFFTACYALLTAIAIYFFASRLAGNRAGFFAALCFGIFSNGPVLQGNSSNTEVFMVLPIVLASHFFLLAVDTEKRSFLVASGFMAAAAILIKPVAISNYFLLLLCVPFIPAREHSFSGRIRGVCCFIIPGLLSAFAVLAYFKAHAALQDLFFWNISYALNVPRPTVSFGRFINNLQLVGKEHLVLWVVAIPTMIKISLQKKDLRNIYLLLFLPASLAGVSLPGHFFVHYFIQIIPALSVLAGIGLSMLMDLARPQQAVGWGLISLATLTTLAVDYDYYLRLTPEEVSLRKYGDIFLQDARMAKYIREHSEEGDYVFQWGWEPGINFLSGRRTPTRYIAMMFLQDAPDPWAALDEMLQNIYEKRTRYIVVQSGREDYFGFDELSGLLKHLYKYELSFGGLCLYRLL